MDEREICICDERDLLDSAVGNIVHLADCNNGGGVEQSQNSISVCPLFRNRGDAALREKRRGKHISIASVKMRSVSCPLNSIFLFRIQNVFSNSFIPCKFSV
jgi:hypothetical protein